MEFGVWSQIQVDEDEEKICIDIYEILMEFERDILPTKYPNRNNN